MEGNGKAPGRPCRSKRPRFNEALPLWKGMEAAATKESESYAGFNEALPLWKGMGRRTRRRGFSAARLQ